MHNLFNRFFLTSLLTLILMSFVIISCDTVVFIADNDGDLKNELYMSQNNGIRVRPLSTGGDVLDFKISPDGSRVAYRADQDTPGVIELYVVGLTGGAPVKVSGTLVENGDVKLLPVAPPNPPFEFDVFNWSSDSAMIAYIANQETDTVYELFVSASDGSSNFKVSGSLVQGGNVIDFEWAPDGSLIAYRADQDINNKYELYATTPAAATTPIKVSNVAPGGGDVVVPRPGVVDDTAGTLYLDAFEWAPDSSWIAYIAEQENDGVFELFAAERISSVPILFGISQKVSGPLVWRGDVEEFKWAPGISLVAYRADQDTNDVLELYTSSPDGSVNVKSSGALAPGGDIQKFEWAPDSSRLAYLADQEEDEVFELYSSSPDGSVNDKVSGPLTTDGDGGDVSVFEWAPDSSRLAYLADQEEDEVFELFSASPDGSVNDKVSGPLTTDGDGGDVSVFKWAPDSSRLAYLADQEEDEVFELYSSLPDCSVNDKVSGPLTSGGDVLEFKWAPHSSRIAYRADQDTDEVFELYSSEPDGGDNVNISDKLVTNGNISTFEWVP